MYPAVEWVYPLSAEGLISYRLISYQLSVVGYQARVDYTASMSFVI